MGEGVGSLGLDYDPASKVATKYSTKTIDTTVDGDTTSYMDFDSYLKLLVAQMSNQDFNDPMSDAEVLNQMATYSMLEGIKNMTSQSNISYASSLVGKAVTITEGDVYDTGMIDSVIVNNGTPYIIVNGVQHELSTITDIVDPDKYNELAKLVGQNAYATVDGTTISGPISNVLIIGGVEWIFIDKQALCKRAAVTMGEPPAATDSDTDSDTNTDNSSTTDTVDDTVVASSAAANSNAVVSKSYEEKAEDLFAELMSTLDGVTAASGTTAASADEYEVYIDNIEEANYAAAVYADYDDVLFSAATNSTDFEVSNRNTSVSSTNASSSDDDTIYRSAEYPTADQRITNDGFRYRRNADLYPEEAAKADAFGTRMYDIAWINNTTVIDQIDTSQAIGTTSGGKIVTDLGFYGRGKIGEVVTFADGTQRCEIVHNNGNSSWLYTTGNYTLAEMCSNSFVPENGVNLTPYEVAIQNYAIKEENVKKYNLRGVWENV